MTVVVCTHWFDPTADHVVAELNQRGVPVFRFDGADFPRRLTMTAELDEEWTGTLRASSRELDLREVSGILYRRPTAFEFDPRMPEPVREWCTREARIGFGGVLAALPVWLNHPHAMAHAEYKPVQLREAVRVGLAVPRTLVTNSPDDARTFCESVGQVIYKPFGAAPPARDGRPQTVYATRVPPADFGDPSIALTAHLLQEWVEHDHAVRAVVVDEEIFAAAIHAGSAAAHTDWRSDYDALSYERVELPGPVRRAVLALMGRLGLRFGALDLLVRPDGSYVYLETNPNGQWAWIEAVAPAIAAAIADALVKGAPAGSG